ncbi:unnamed protein product [Heligmosomoides polygyrus]|uniref:Uncharacterized protein n=1 Tax=Heligmosomoides polygyrus TaxID=6339 RepID=A0A183FTL6_HELPZ|nr:unnamed protein product [Heligmosomoides polygyrus]
MEQLGRQWTRHSCPTGHINDVLREERAGKGLWVVGRQKPDQQQAILSNLSVRVHDTTQRPCSSPARTDPHPQLRREKTKESAH